MSKTGKRTQPADAAILSELAGIIASRRDGDAGTSYTARLLAGGAERCARKFGEEALELVIAALGSEHDEIAAEAADVLYHLLVLLEAGEVPLADVLDILRDRQGVGGLVEKAARGPDR